MSSPATLGLEVHCKPVLTRAIMILADLLALSMAALTGNLIIHRLEVFNDPGSLLRGLGAVPLCMVAFWLLHLYEFPPPNPPEEMARTAQTTSVVYAAVFGVTWIAYDHLSLWVLGVIVSWLASGVLVVFARAMVRRLFAFRPWWGLISCRASPSPSICSLNSRRNSISRPASSGACGRIASGASPASASSTPPEEAVPSTQQMGQPSTCTWSTRPRTVVAASSGSRSSTTKPCTTDLPSIGPATMRSQVG